MKPFDLEAAKRGEPICFGPMPVRFVAHAPDAKEFERVICVGPKGAIYLMSDSGKVCPGLAIAQNGDIIAIRKSEEESKLALTMAPPKRRTVWLVMRYANISCKALASKEDANIFLDAQMVGDWHGPYPLEVLDK